MFGGVRCVLGLDWRDAATEAALRVGLRIALPYQIRFAGESCLVILGYRVAVDSQQKRLPHDVEALCTAILFGFVIVFILVSTHILHEKCIFRA